MPELEACDEWGADGDEAKESDIDTLTSAWLRGDDVSQDPRWVRLEQAK